MPAHKAATCSCSSLRRGIASPMLTSVQHLGEQWLKYLRLRDLLRRSPEARQRYEDAKLRLVNEVGDDRTTSTEGKTEIVASLLDQA